MKYLIALSVATLLISSPAFAARTTTPSTTMANCTGAPVIGYIEQLSSNAWRDTDAAILIQKEDGTNEKWIANAYTLDTDAGRAMFNTEELAYATGSAVKIHCSPKKYVWSVVLAPSIEELQKK